jgi:predicted RNA-binding Zn ribbon-like protein
VGNVRSDRTAPQETPANASDAPGELELVRAFVNTLDIEAGTDALGTSDAARGWLAGRGCRVSGLREADLRRLLGLREVIRDAVSSRGGAEEAEALGRLNRIAATHPVTVRLGGPAEIPLAPTARGIDGFIERVLTNVAASTIDGTWSRLKACPNDRCRWLFYDHSRNGSRTWCSMGVCGSRAKMRTYRSRRRANP